MDALAYGCGNSMLPIKADQLQSSHHTYLEVLTDIVIDVGVYELLVEENTKRRRQRRWWERTWIARRNSRGCYHMLVQELMLEDVESYRKWLRMTTEAFYILLDKVAKRFTYADTRMRKSIHADERLALTLRYLATGESQSSLQGQFRIGQSTISGIIPEVCQAIYEELKDEYLKVPQNEAEWNAIAEGFEQRWQFPNCIGALDGKFILIRAPHEGGSLYYTYKGGHSVVLMAMVDADLKFTYVDVGRNGRMSDGGIWAMCSLNAALKSNILNIPQARPLPLTDEPLPLTAVADSAFPLKPNIMKPFSYRDMNYTHRIYNYRLSRARRVVENAFGILASRFRIYQSPIWMDPEKVRVVVLASVTLHNFLRTLNSTRERYTPHGSMDREVNDTIVEGSWRQDEPFGAFANLTYQGNHSNAAKDVRNRFVDYFNGVGKVEWQDRMIN